MFNETSYFDIDEGLCDTPFMLSPSQEKKYRRLIQKGKTEKATKKMERWTAAQGGGSTGGGPVTGGGSTATGGATQPGGATRPAGGEMPAAEGGGFLEGEIFGIPFLYILIGVGAFLVLKKR